MAKASIVRPEEREEIMQIAAKMKAENPQISPRKIGEVVGRSEDTVFKVMSDSRFNRLKAKYKKKIDSTNAKTMDLASDALQKEVKEGKIKAYQLIGLLKVLSEITYPNTTPIFGGDNASINVQVVRGGVTYNSTNKPKETTQAQNGEE